MSATRSDNTPELFESTELRAGIVVDIAFELPLDRTYSYCVPTELAEMVKPGGRVEARMGKAGRLATGFVISVSNEQWQSTLRPIERVVDEIPLLSEPLLRLGLWMARYYACPIGPALSAMVPASHRHGKHARSVRCVWLARAELRSALVTERVPTDKQQGVLTYLERQSAHDQEHAIPLAVISAETGGTAAVINGLEKRGFVSSTSINADVIELKRLAAEVVEVESDPELMSQQVDAVMRIREGIDAESFRAFVLYGVTGSGKTEVYVRAIRHALAAGKQAIVLVPEIALSTQTATRLSRRFQNVAVLNSAMSESSRRRAWQAISSGQADVVIGTRSAVFAPCKRLGLVVVDEEPEGSYKNLAAPRFHTRDVAVMRAHVEGCPVILGSATPSLETWHNAATRSSYTLLRMPDRVEGMALPTMHLVDMRREQSEHRGIHLLSRLLEDYLSKTLERGEQAVLLLNRRGYANYLFCPKCRTPIVCPNCGVLMVYHQLRRLAECHHCRATLVIPPRCSMAGCDGHIVRFGMGTERVEAEVLEKFAGARVARMDSDVMNRTEDYVTMLQRFGSGEIDVLVGTQMLAKGLDFPRVSLVGVISADTVMTQGDFRGMERTFQLVLQVAGRGGRSGIASHAIIQTYHPELPAVRYAMEHDFESFAAQELSERQSQELPPFSRMVRLILADGRRSKVKDESVRLAAEITDCLKKAGIAASIYDPMPCALARLRNQFRYEILMTFSTADAMMRGLDALRAARMLTARVASFVVDVDPVSFQ